MDLGNIKNSDFKIKKKILEYSKKENSKGSERVLNKRERVLESGNLKIYLLEIY
ncbi:hypothetical protein LEP1GSC008_0387 [Leptospira kirschneri serovar Bulgarica str. Nikolaevo]|uniref:Uncharacterized protein n=1 Tax=Leptospira kirschneri serovar Bulgarica str. Nikolaevo TaxID=1240687 RepID=M6FGC3_9LEPT|nr:hypothetical protein LEP1GSC008_0387 [Leptospira kirschneri serovar Bulgarica str. Nikolaevo]